VSECRKTGHSDTNREGQVSKTHFSKTEREKESLGPPVFQQPASPHISHTFRGEVKTPDKTRFFQEAMISPRFWNGIAELSRLHNGHKTAGKIFSSVPKPMASTAPHSLWCGLGLQV